MKRVFHSCSSDSNASVAEVEVSQLHGEKRSYLPGGGMNMMMLQFSFHLITIYSYEITKSKPFDNSK